jgi:hypothetical protein
MFIFQSKEVKRFNSLTGEPYTKKGKPKRVAAACDYCGRVFALDNDEQPDVLYRAVDNTGAEAQWEVSADPEYKLQDGSVFLAKSASIFTGVQRVFWYCQNWDDNTFCERRMLLEWLWAQGGIKLTKATVKEMDTFLSANKLSPRLGGEGEMIAHAMYDARIRVIGKLLLSYSPAELMLEGHED